MLEVLNEVIKNIKQSEKSALIVLKGFNEEIFKEISKDIEPAFFSEFFLEENFLQILLENKKRFFKKLQLLENGVYLVRYEELLILEQNLILYDNTIFILENNLFKYYLYDFHTKEKENVINFIKNRDNEILDIHEKNIYSSFFSDLILNKENIYISYKDLNINSEEIKIEIKKVFSYEEYTPNNFQKIDNSFTKIEEYSINNFICNEELKYKILNNKFKDKLFILINKNYLNKTNVKNDLGVLKYLCSLKKINLICCTKINDLKNGFRADIQNLLKRYWNSNEFRVLKFYSNPDISNQKIELSQGDLIEEVIEEVENSKKNLNYNNIFITAPTGSGKSIFFQIPALYIANKYNYVTIIISPLKALMKDQIENLKLRGVNNACFLNSDLSFIEKTNYVEKIKQGEISIIYLSPELLQVSSDITNIIGDREIGLVVIDEAHTVSTWGKNFRIDYLLIGNYVQKIKQYKKYNFPILALTATAVYSGENDTIFEILEELKIDSFTLHIGEARKDNIKFDINLFTPEEGSYKFLKSQKTQERIKEKIDKDKKTIFYFPYASQAKELYNIMNSNLKESVTHYTGKSSYEERVVGQNDFKNNKKKVMLATKAFGMGVDISDIENIYHYALSGDLADYVQEIGRCARNNSIEGIAQIDFNRMDLKFTKILRSLSSIKQWQMKLVAEKLFELYKLNKFRSSFLVSIESFSHIFSERENDLENKVKQALLFLEKDLLKQYTFPVIIARPRSFFSALFVTINKDYENEILTDENREYFKKLTTLENNSRITKKYNYKGDIENIFIRDTGDIYEFNTSKFWEDKYTEKSYPQFIRDFIKGNIFNSDYISNRIKLKIEITDSSQKILSEIEYYLEKISLALKESKGFFTKEDLENNLKNFLKINNKIFIKKLSNLILTYVSNVTYFFNNTNNDKFLIEKKDPEKNEEKYKLNLGKYFKFRSKIISKFTEMFDIDSNDRIFIKYLSRDSQYLEVATLIQSLNLGTYEVTGGSASKIFIRLNDPLKIEYISKNNYYSNTILKDIEKRGQRADKILEDFFTTTMTDTER